MKLKIYLPALLLFVFAIACGSCTKEETTPTQGEVTARQLQELISANSIKRVYPVKYGEVFPNSFPATAGQTFKFSNGFLTVDYGRAQGYNLNYLVNYAILNVNIEPGGPGKALILYME